MEIENSVIFRYITYISCMEIATIATHMLIWQGCLREFISLFQGYVAVNFCVNRARLTDLFHIQKKWSGL